MQLILATRNQGKLEELKHLLSGLNMTITSLVDHPEIPDIVEDGATFLANARKKASVVAEATGQLALADDSGLQVEALGGRPGVHSARYAGNAAANNAKLLEEMREVPDGERQAAFVCTMVLVGPHGREWSVEGRCEGEILHEPRGGGGFGFDPLFFLPQEGMSMAELPIDRKNAISHRGQALRQMKEIIVEFFGKKGNP